MESRITLSNIAFALALMPAISTAAPPQPVTFTEGDGFRLDIPARMLSGSTVTGSDLSIRFPGKGKGLVVRRMNPEDPALGGKSPSEWARFMSGEDAACASDTPPCPSWRQARKLFSDLGPGRQNETRRWARGEVRILRGNRQFLLYFLTPDRNRVWLVSGQNLSEDEIENLIEGAN